MATHRIRRQRLQLEAASQDDAFALRQSVRESVAPAVTHALERVFDELGPDGEVIRIDRLAINVRLTGDAEEAHALEDVVLRQVREQVNEALTRQGSTTSAVRITRQASTGDRFERLMRYVGDGRLSWSDVGGGRLALVDELAKTLDRRLDEVMERWAARPADARVGPMTRLLQLLPESEWPRVVALTATSLATALPALQSVIRGISNRQQRIALGAVVIVIGASGGRRMRVTSSDHLDAPRVNDALEPLLTDLPAETRAFIRRAEGLPRDLDVHLKAIVAQSPELSASAPPNPGGSIHPAFDNDNGRDASVSVGVLVSHAGLILLHPFLSQLFRALGLGWQPNAGFAPHDANRAAAALVYAATGAEEALTFELDFVRAILNVPTDLPLLTSSGVLTDVDRAEVDGMLQAVANHWSALGRTSVDGLRRAFLQRAGLLDEVENGYRLRVQLEGFDVLLDQLPWSIATVRLPWMDRAIFTEWQAS